MTEDTKKKTSVAASKKRGCRISIIPLLTIVVFDILKGANKRKTDS